MIFIFPDYFEKYCELSILTSKNYKLYLTTFKVKKRSEFFFTSNCETIYNTPILLIGTLSVLLRT